MSEQKKKNLLHHIAVGIGFVGLLVWLYIGRELGFLDWIILQVPRDYAGAALMVGIMIIMTPGFFIWTRYNRWIEKRLKIEGIYYEDGFYKDPEEPKGEKQDK